MTALLSPSMASSLMSLFRSKDAPITDQNDPAHSADMLGTICRVHNHPRYLGEAPMVPFVTQDASFQAIKERSFPNSWAAIASYAATAESRGICGWTRRPRMVVVRYCEKCRDEAEEWLRNNNE